MLLENIHIVLVRPSHPGNIGAAARAMKTMGLTSLTLVAPSQFPSPEAEARAAGADDILAAARVTTTLSQALASCHLVIGTSARLRTIEWPVLDPKECAMRLTTAAAAGQVALVFGQERTGLHNDELDLCHYCVTIPANPAFSSLNLAAAVQIMAYELYQASAMPVAVANEQDEDTQNAATMEEMQHLYQHLEQVLIELEFLDPEHPRKLMRRLYRLFNRSELEQREVNILRGILTAVQQNRE